MERQHGCLENQKPVHELLIEVQSSLYAFVYSLLGSGEDAYDVLQDANLAILAKADEYDHSRAFFTWACRFAQLQVLAYRQRRGRDRLWFDDELVNTLADEFGGCHEEPSIRLEALTACLGSLSPAHRSIVSQYYELGRPQAEIATSLGKGAHAIRVLMYRIRKQLFDCIQRKMASEGSL